MSNTAHPCYNVDIKRNIVENNNGKRKDLWKMQKTDIQCFIWKMMTEK